LIRTIEVDVTTFAPWNFENNVYLLSIPHKLSFKIIRNFYEKMNPDTRNESNMEWILPKVLGFARQGIKKGVTQVCTGRASVSAAFGCVLTAGILITR